MVSDLTEHSVVHVSNLDDDVNENLNFYVDVGYNDQAITVIEETIGSNTVGNDGDVKD